jgi:uncharacterized membrane protein
MSTIVIRALALGLAAMLGATAARGTDVARFYYSSLVVGGYAGEQMHAGAINNQSEFVGSRSLTTLSLGLPWFGATDEPLTMAAGLTFVSASADAINDSGQFAGVGAWLDGTKAVYRYTPGVGAEILGGLDGASGWVAGINAAGVVAGTWSILGGPYQGARAFLAPVGGPLVGLPTLGGHDAYAAALNDSGVLVGAARVSGPINRMRACYWQAGQCIPLGPEEVWSQAEHISAGGLVLGTYIDASQTSRSFIQLIGGAWQPLPAPAGATIARGHDMNAAGQIVGTSDAGAFIYTPGQGVAVVDIDFTPTQISDAGCVVGAKLEPPYVNKAWYWSPETGSSRLDDVIFPPLGWSIAGVVDFNARDEMLVNGQHLGRNVAALIFPTERGDLNCDGVVDFDDIDPFVAALSGQATYVSQYPNCNWPSADINRDGEVDFSDIDAFVALFSQQ